MMRIAGSSTTTSPLTVKRARRECGCATRASRAATTYLKSNCLTATSPLAIWAAAVRVEATSNSTSATNKPPTQGTAAPGGVSTTPGPAARRNFERITMKGTRYERTQSQLAKATGKRGSGVAVVQRNWDGRAQRPDFSAAGRLGHCGDAPSGPGRLYQSACRILVSAVYHQHSSVHVTLLPHHRGEN